MKRRPRTTQTLLRRVTTTRMITTVIQMMLTRHKYHLMVEYVG